MSLGETKNIGAKVIPEIAFYKKLYYSSNNKRVVTVDAKGNMTAHKSGEAEITIWNENEEVSEICTVYVGSQNDVDWENTEPEDNDIVEVNPNTNKKVKGFKITAKGISDKKIKIQWNKQKNAKSYVIMRKNPNAKKYKKIKTVKASKKSYKITARAYGRRAKLVNAEYIDSELIKETGKMVYGQDNSGNDMGICQRGRIYTIVDGDYRVKTIRTKVISKKIVWSSSDTDMVQVDQKGNVTTFQKEGECYISMRLHNGKIAKYKIKVINYARPKSFPYYTGEISEINELLKIYKEDLCDIATFFTIYGKKRNWRNDYI